MIEIKPGWTAHETSTKILVQDQAHILKVYQKRVKDTEERILSLRENCPHTRVIFNAQDMFCEICGVRLHK